MTDERRVEVAAEALHARWCHLAACRSGEHTTGDYDAARAVVAALDAHDGDLRVGVERQRKAGEHYGNEARHGWATALVERDASRAQVAAVLALHAPHGRLDDLHCAQHCPGSYPCATARAAGAS